MKYLKLFEQHKNLFKVGDSVRISDTSPNAGGENGTIMLIHGKGFKEIPSDISEDDNNNLYTVEWEDGKRYTYIKDDLTLIKSRKRVFDPINDPFGEDSWHVQEGIFNRNKNPNDIDVGDKVKIVGNGLTFFGRIGKVEKKLGKGEVFVRLMNGELIPHYYKDLELVKKMKRIINLEDDPFGEDSLGFIQESLGSIQESLLNDISVSYDNKDQFKEIMKILQDEGYEWMSGTKPLDKKWSDISFPSIYLKNKIISRDSKHRNTIHYSEFLKLLSNSNKSRILNLEDDPFGEENYGFIQESVNNDLKIGDRVMYNGMSRWVGYEGNIVNFEEHGSVRVRYDKITHNDQHHMICHISRLIKLGSRKLNLEDDPFGEENYGFIQENMKPKSDVISIEDLILSQDSYDDFLKEIEKLILGKNISIYTLNDNNKYELYNNCLVTEIRSNADIMFNPKLTKIKDYDDYKKYIINNKDCTAFFIHTDKFVKRGNQLLKDIEVINSSDKIVVERDKILNLDEDPFGEEDYNNVIGGLNEQYNTKKVVYYTQTGVDKKKVDSLSKVISSNWIKNNPVAFEVYEDKMLFLTEGHHRFEACLKLGDRQILKDLFESALYYPVNFMPKGYAKKVVYI